MELPLDRLLGRQIEAANGRVIGRIEEVRVDAASWLASELVIGEAGLLERLSLAGRRLIGAKTGGYVARWDQVDVSDPRRPRLRCGVDELQVL